MLQKAEWPGIATAVGIVLTLTLIIVGSRDDFHLKDWQPLMAAIVALAGGALAYLGAMAKVYADQEKDRREFDRKKIGVYLRLSFANEKMRERATDLVKFFSGYRLESQRFGPEIIKFEEPEEIEEAWRSLELFPISVSEQLNIIRSELPRMSRLLRSLPTSHVFEVGTVGVLYSDPLRPYSESCKTIASATKKLAAALADEINRIKTTF
jgi:hypothetical protein